MREALTLLVTTTVGALVASAWWMKDDKGSAFCFAMALVGIIAELLINL